MVKTLVKSAPIADIGFDPQTVYPTIRDLLEADDPDQSDPRFPLVLKYWDWEEAEAKKRSDYRSTLGGDRGITPQEAGRMFDIGPLESEQNSDYMMIHTRDAHRLFIGRGADPDGKKNRIPGAKSTASALRYLWHASAADHPYADWALMMAEEQIDICRSAIKEAKAGVLRQLEDLAQQGLHLTVLRSRAPVRIDLGFKSPYGFLMAMLVVEFDHFVRAIKTIQSRDLMTSDEARLAIRRQLQPLRSMFDKVMRYQSILTRPAFADLKRADFVDPKSRDLRQRIVDLQQVWPGLPQGVFDKTLSPRHSRRLGLVQNVVQADEVTTERGGLI